MIYKPLNIPKRDRKKGEYIVCQRCRRNVMTKCPRSGKALYTCKFPESHRFQSKVTDKKTKRTIPIKTYPKELRDYRTFSKLHLQEVEKFELRKGKTFKDSKPIRPSRLQDAMRMYNDWYRDENVPSFKKKNYSEKTIKNELDNLITFKEALVTGGYSFESLLVYDISDEHVSSVHDYLEERYANKTYNNKIYTIKSLFTFLIEQGYNLKNPFKSVKNKATSAVKTFIEIDHFKALIDSLTVENGIKFEKDRGQVKRKSLYRPWLNYYYRLALYTGGRPEGLVKLRISDVQENFIKVYDFKVSRKKKIDQVRFVILSKELETLIAELKEEYGLKDDMYLIDPEEENRIKIARHASKAFTHYWNQLDVGYKATCYDLKDTHITLMLKRFGSKYEGIYGAHDSFKTSLENYAKEEVLIGELRGKSMLG